MDCTAHSLHARVNRCAANGTKKMLLCIETLKEFPKYKNNPKAIKALDGMHGAMTRAKLKALEFSAPQFKDFDMEKAGEDLLECLEREEREEGLGGESFSEHLQVLVELQGKGEKKGEREREKERKDGEVSVKEKEKEKEEEVRGDEGDKETEALKGNWDTFKKVLGGLGTALIVIALAAGSGGGRPRRMSVYGV